MKNLIIASVTMAILNLVGCAKDGATGPQGPAGINGTNGTNGNANVREFFYTNDSIKVTHDFTRRVPIRYSLLDSALSLVYYFDQQGNAWYTSPGLGAYAAYQTRNLAIASPSPDSTDFILRLYDPTGGTSYTGTVKLSKVKIIVAPASTFGKQAPVDYNDYRATMKYYGLPE